MKAILAILTCAALAAAVALWFGAGTASTGGGAAAESRPTESLTPDPATAAAAGAAERTEVEIDEPDDEETGVAVSRPAVRHAPGGGPIAPIDITNLAPESLGKKRWFRLVADNEGWRQLWTDIHAHDGPRHEGLDEPEGPPALRAGEEAMLVIGLGERPRMDYAFELEAVESKFGEARYRFRVNTLKLGEAAQPVEVLTRPVRVYVVPTAPMKKLGLVVEDGKGYELARFDPPQD